MDKKGGAASTEVSLPESRVVKIWQDYLPGRTDLATEDGGKVAIVYPGRLNDDRGADLCDAVIANDGGIQRGDVEVHVRSSSWWGHRHHRDPLYNRVILHVVYWHDTPAIVTLQNGRQVPTLALQRFIEAPDDRGALYPLARRTMPCRAVVRRRGDDFIGGVLDAAGDRRFFTRVAALQAELLPEDAGQVLYRGMMGALGYTKNKLSMMELARRLPLPQLAAAVVGVVSREERLARYQALLLGTAGLLPSQPVGRYQRGSPADEWVDRLEETWAASGRMPAMSPGDWQSFKVRPGNLPRRRLAAMSYLLHRYGPEGLLPVLVDELEKAAPDGSGGGLEGWLLVGPGGYWGQDTDFGLPAVRTIPALLGSERAEIIVVNVLLPFAVAWGPAASRPDLAEKALGLYRRYPRSPENTLERHMRRQLGISRCPVGTARRQQGLIHIYKTLCAQGECRECPLR